MRGVTQSWISLLWGSVGVGGRWWKDQTEPPAEQRQRGTDRQTETNTNRQTDRQPQTMKRKTTNSEAT